MIIYQKHLFKLIPKSISRVFKSLKKLKMKEIFLISWFFVSLLSDSWQFQKQLMTKSEAYHGFKAFGKYKDICKKYKEKLAQIKRNLRKEKQLYLFCHTSIASQLFTFIKKSPLCKVTWRSKPTRRSNFFLQCLHYSFHLSIPVSINITTNMHIQLSVTF